MSFHYLDGVPKLKSAFFVFVTPDTNPHEFLGPSPKRRGLIMSADSINASNVVIRPGGASLIDGGFNAAAGQPPLYFTLENIGGLLQGPWTAQSGGPNQHLSVIEVTED